MGLTTDNDKIASIYMEGKIKNMAMGAAMGAASLMGNPNTTMADTTYNSAYQDHKVIQIDEFVKLWSKYYQTTNNPKKEQRVKEVLEGGIEIPQNAKSAVDVAVYVFGGDMGVTPNVLEDLLIYTGAVESNYKTRKQIGGGPARGYWQVEPKTAADNLKNGKALLGKKFYSTFKKELDYIGEYDQKRGYNLTNIETVLEKSDKFAAAMAAMWWIRNAHKAL